uniref:Uncharacterized protein n=1 Tax=Octopus bimaculoides TaxID=37653 RepID=A0A0L8G9F9_OCTBM
MRYSVYLKLRNDIVVTSGFYRNMLLFLQDNLLLLFYDAKLHVNMLVIVVFHYYVVPSVLYRTEVVCLGTHSSTSPNNENIIIYVKKKIIFRLLYLCTSSHLIEKIEKTF